MGPLMTSPLSCHKWMLTVPWHASEHTSIPAGVWVDSGIHPTVQNTHRNVYFGLRAHHAGVGSCIPHYARVAELADARDLGSRG